MVVVIVVVVVVVLAKAVVMVIVVVLATVVVVVPAEMALHAPRCANTHTHPPQVVPIPGAHTARGVASSHTNIHRAVGALVHGDLPVVDAPREASTAVD